MAIPMTGLNLIDNDWTTYAKCRDVDPEVMFPSDKHPGQIARAKAVCSGCPVMDACAKSAQDNGDRYGVWAGMTVEEHRAARKSAYRRQWRQARRVQTTTAA